VVVVDGLGVRVALAVLVVDRMGSDAVQVARVVARVDRLPVVRAANVPVDRNS
jgi:hypothetical protein